MNPCFNGRNSCSACCGLFNLALDENERIKWLQKNTDLFIGLDLSGQHALFEFRQKKETQLNQYKIHENVYVCPFLGFANGKNGKKQPGCLLHPAGSPHKQVAALNRPQNFSFYGESICAAYDCLAKQSYSDKKTPAHRWAYARWVSNHNLKAVVEAICRNNPAVREPLSEAIWKILEKAEIPVTSFEAPLVLDCYETHELWSVLGTLLQPEGYLDDVFYLQPKGIRLGEELAAKMSAYLSL